MKNGTRSKTGTSRSAALPPMPDAAELRERIARRAYDLFLQGGCRHGQDVQNWLEAEKTVLSELGLKVKPAGKTEGRTRLGRHLSAVRTFTDE
jgi:hypothetical protein